MVRAGIHDDLESYRRRAKLITAHTPTPYGSIPKRRKNRQSQLSVSTSDTPPMTPYPCFDLSINTSSGFTSFLQRVFSALISKPDVAPSPVGFMPRVSTSPEVATSPLDVFAPTTSHPIVIKGHRLDDNQNDDTCSCLSTSTASCGSLSSSCSSCYSSSSLSSSFSFPSTPYTSSDNCDLLFSKPDLANNPCSSTAALSDLLCDHYVQSTTRQLEDDEPKEVPLETFRMFEAPSPDDDERWFVWQSPKHWTLVTDDTNKPPAAKGRSSTTSSSSSSSTQNSSSNEAPVRRIRDIRANGAHLRMIVAEANMMRAQKIIGPLRPRGYLPRRMDVFVAKRPSKLRHLVISAA